jgi:hypothetical protein
MADADVRQMVADLPVPEFESTAFTQPPALGEATVGVEFQAGRTTERGYVVIGLRWASNRGPFEILDADLRLEPMPPSRSHLSLSGSYDASSRDADEVVDYSSQERTERYVRRFLAGVADMLEQRPTGPS